MIAVLGRPRVHRPQPDGGLAPAGLAADVSLAIGRAGAQVELVGSIGDDPEGDEVVVSLGRAGVGHAALLRDPSARTPTLGSDDGSRRLPRLDAEDIDLGLRYLPQCRVVVLADSFEGEALERALEAAAFHSAAVVLVASPGVVDAASLADSVTLLERPGTEEDGGDLEAGDGEADAADEAAFVAFVAEYAIRLDRGESPADAFGAALGDTAWEPSAD